jgi:Fe-S-cluster-containing hydrogenase component 2
MMSVVCRQNCRVPYCEAVCPSGAITAHTNTVYVESDDCLGCDICRRACTAFSFDRTLEKKSRLWLMGKAGLAKATPAEG